MTELARYRVLDRQAPRRAADPGVGERAEAIARELAARTPKGPTGNLAAGWVVERGHHLAVRVISNPVAYGRHVEFGTAEMPAEPFLGPVLAEHRAAMRRH